MEQSEVQQQKTLWQKLNLGKFEIAFYLIGSAVLIYAYLADFLAK